MLAATLWSPNEQPKSANDVKIRFHEAEVIVFARFYFWIIIPLTTSTLALA